MRHLLQVGDEPEREVGEREYLAVQSAATGGTATSPRDFAGMVDGDRPRRPPPAGSIGTWAHGRLVSEDAHVEDDPGDSSDTRDAGGDAGAGDSLDDVDAPIPPGALPPPVWDWTTTTLDDLVAAARRDLLRFAIDPDVDAETLREAVPGTAARHLPPAEAALRVAARHSGICAIRLDIGEGQTLGDLARLAVQAALQGDLDDLADSIEDTFGNGAITGTVAALTGSGPAPADAAVPIPWPPAADLVADVASLWSVCNPEASAPAAEDLVEAACRLMPPFGNADAFATCAGDPTLAGRPLHRAHATSAGEAAYDLLATAAAERLAEAIAGVHVPERG